MASKPKAASAANTSDTKLVRELAKILNDTDLNEIEMRKGKYRCPSRRG